MNRLIHSTQGAITEKYVWKSGVPAGAQEGDPNELFPEGVGKSEQDEDFLQVQRRRQAWRAAGGAIAGVMAAKRATQ